MNSNPLLAAGVAAGILSAAPAAAQRDLSGEWSARYHEDQEHRIPGPALGDYTGLPINDAARLKADVVEYRDMVTIIRDRVQNLIRKGLTLAQVTAARPTLDYDGRYGSADTFIGAVFRDLTGQP